ncbi:MAG: protein kinase [Candidatus Gracilibacteria bacterium]
MERGYELIEPSDNTYSHVARLLQGRLDGTSERRDTFSIDDIRDTLIERIYINPDPEYRLLHKPVMWISFFRIAENLKHTAFLEAKRNIPLEEIMEMVRHQVLEFFRVVQDVFAARGDNLRVIISEGDEAQWWAELGNPDLVMKRVKAEYQNVAAVSAHPHISDERQVGDVWLAPNYRDIPTLEVLQNELSELEKLKMVVEAMEGCSALHQMGIIHGDVKPGNIMVFGSGKELRSKLCDLEHVKRIGVDYCNNDGGDTDYSEAGFYGHVFSHQKVSEGTDVFSFATTLLEMYLGAAHKKPEFVSDTRRLFSHGMDEDAVFEALVCAKSYSDGGNIPEDVMRMIAKMMVFEHEKRIPLRKVIEILKMRIEELEHS